MEETSIQLTSSFVPDIKTINTNGNPTIVSPDGTWIQLRQTRDTLGDVDSYVKFVRSIESWFRGSKFYKQYKAHIINDIGLNRCQFLSNLPVMSEEDKKAPVTYEMNHVIITLFDEALIICEHLLNTVGSISTPEVVQLMEEEHRQHNIPLVVMCKTVHEAYHSDSMVYVHPNMVFGKWYDFLRKYYTGITPDIAAKIKYYIEKSEEMYGSDDNGLLEVVNTIEEWGNRNNGFIDLNCSYADPDFSQYAGMVFGGQ